MALQEMVKTDPRNLLNLQRGDFAHFVEKGLVINDVKTVETRHYVDLTEKVFNPKPWRLLFNITFSVAVFTTAVLTGFYPVSLLLFFALYDLRTVQRMTLPINKSNFIPWDKIEKVELSRGKLGFNFAKVFVKTSQGPSMKNLRLYDSDSTFTSAHRLFSERGLLVASVLDQEHKDIQDLPSVTIGNGVELRIENDQLLLIENGKFNVKREDPYKYFRFISILAFCLGIIMIIGKIVTMVDQYAYQLVDFTVLLFFIGLTTLPYRMMQKTRPNVIQKNEITGLKEAKKQWTLSLKGWGNFPLRLSIPKVYTQQGDIERLKAFIES